MFKKTSANSLPMLLDPDLPQGCHVSSFYKIKLAIKNSYKDLLCYPLSNAQEQSKIQQLSKCGPQTSNSVTWDLARNADSWASPRTY